MDEKKVYVLAITPPPTNNLIQLLTLIHTLKTHHAKHITAAIPCLGYLKADKLNSITNQVAKAI